MRYYVKVLQVLNQENYCVEHSGIIHKTREDARKELASITRAEREYYGIIRAWIEVLKDEED